jgi:serine/threonine-protein kinase
MKRFEREARMLAALNHPSIAAIYGLEEWGGKQVLVMELVKGETLAERLRKGPLEVKEVLRIAIQIAEALEAAHEKRIVHRDLKPSNVKVTPEGKVKVLDFGLARAWAGEGGGVDLSTEPTITERGTQAGAIVGTPAYMSPEQARGKEVDKETDIWAFGCVVYELLTGRSAFGRETMTDTVAAILKEEPEWGKLPQSTPENLRCLLRRCLQKEVNCRLRDIGDARIELEETLGIRASTRPTLVSASSSRKPLLVAAVSIALALGSLAFAAWQIWSRVSVEQPVTRFSIQLEPGQRIVASFNPSLEISPNGRILYYMVPAKTGGWLPQLRMLDQLEPKTPFSSTGGAPVFSPDSQWVCFADMQSRTLQRAALSGGAPLTITSWEWIYRGFWGTDGYLYWTPGARSGIARTPITGGDARPVTELDTSRNEQSHRFAQMLPGGKHIVYTVAETTMSSFDEARIVVQSLDTGKRKTLVEGGTCPRYSPTGKLLYARSGNVYAVPLDLRRLEITGPPVAVVEGVLMSRNTGAAYYSLSETGTLAYVPGVAVDGERQLVWVDRQGKETPLPLPPRSYLYPHLSPDGKQLALEIEGPSHNFYLYDFARGVLTKMTLDGLSHAPVWSPDGKRIGFRSWKLGGMTMWSMPADRSAPEERLLDAKGMQSVVSWSPDGNYIAYVDMFPETRSDVLVLPLKGEHKPIPLAHTSYYEGSPKFSPDGKWVVYCSNESGRAEVFVQPFPGPGPKIQISTEGGSDPLWRRAGGELYYRDGDKMMVVEVRTQPSFTAGRPRLLWQGHYSPGMSSSCGMPGVTSFNYDVTPDGQRFLMVKDLHQDVASNRIYVVVNWTQELARRMAQKN